MDKIKDYPPYLDYPKPCKPQTNADRIRSMSDEELAKYIYEIGFDCHLCSEHERLSDSPFLSQETCDDNCFEHCLEWLQEPVNVGNKPFYRKRKCRLGNSFGWWRVPYCPHCKRKLGMLLAEQKPDKCPMCNRQLDWRDADGKAD